MMRLNITRFWLVSLFVAGLGLTAVACGDPDEGTSEETLNNDSDPGNNDTDNPDNNDAEDPVADCSQPEPLSGTISDDLTLTEDTCYRVDGGLKVSSGALLTIEPGVVVEFAPDTGLSIDGGKIHAQGTDAKPIYLTGINKAAGSWNGVFVTGSNSPQNLLKHVVIEYGGPDSGRKALVYFNDNSRSRFKIEDSTFRHSANWGIIMERNDGPQYLDSFTNNTITSNKKAMWMHVGNVGDIGEGNSFAGNDDDYINITGTLTDDQTWQAQDVPYRSEGIQVSEATLTITEGVTVESTVDSGLSVDTDAALTAEGTDDKPITFRGIEDVAGAWKGIFVNASNNPANKFDHVLVQNGGAGGRKANLYFGDNAGPVRFVITNSEFSGSLEWGISMETNQNTHRLTTFADNKITNNKHGIRLNANDLGEIDPSNQFSGNEDTDVQIGGTVADDQTWEATDAVYTVDQDGIAVDDAHLSIAEGVELEFETGSLLTIREDASLTATGTSASPILMSATAKANGGWNGVGFESSPGQQNALEYVTVEYGGDGENDGNLYLKDNAGGVKISIENCTFRHSGGYGIYIEHNDNDPQLEGCTGNTYDDNDEGQTNWTDQEC